MLLARDEVRTTINTPGLLNVLKEIMLKGHRLANSFNSETLENIEVVVGSDYLGRYIQGVSRVCGINVFETTAGLIIFGTIPMRDPPRIEVSNIISNRVLVHDECNLSDLWELERVGITPTIDTPIE